MNIINRCKQTVFLLAILLTSISAFAQATQVDTSKNKLFIRVSPRNPRYFETTDGSPWTPVEVNYLIFNINSEQQVFADMENFFKAFSANGGNSIRLWGGPTSFFEVEDELGVYNTTALSRLSSTVSLAKKYGIRIKVCLEVARNFKKAASPFYKKHYSKDVDGPFASFAEYINSKKGKTAYLNRAKQYINKFKNEPAIYDWELWNEMNTVSEGDWFDFTKEMLDSVRSAAPRQLCSQSMSSLDGIYAERGYKKYLTLTNNDIVCVHRYIDEGALDSIAYGPLDVSLNQAVTYISSSVVIRPLFVNETGAVKPRHTGDSPMYNYDFDGEMLHDMLFCPFFSGAAGPGSAWHNWVYIRPRNLWYHYKRFTTAIKGINPITEYFKPFKLSQTNVNFYGLAGKNTVMIWCRDANSNYKTELEQRKLPLMRSGVKLSLKDISPNKKLTLAKSYDPWKDQWTTLKIVNGYITLPSFLRSIVLKLS